MAVYKKNHILNLLGRSSLQMRGILSYQKDKSSSQNAEMLKQEKSSAYQ